MAVREQKVRLVDVAREAGVSVMCVSSVLNQTGKNLVKVSPQTAERIREVSRRLNYQPNLTARALRGAPLKLIGVLIDSQALAAKHFLVELEKVADANGYQLLVGQSHDNIANFHNAYLLLRQYGVAGIICLSHDYPGGHEELEKYFAKAEKTVFLGDPGLPGQPFVGINRHTAVCDAVSGMRRSGARRIGLLIADDNLKYREQILAGYRDGLGGLPEYIYTYRYFSDPVRISETAGDVISKFILPERLDGLFAMNDFHAAAILQQLPAAGIRCPEDFQICGYDDEPFCHFLTPSLSSVAPELTDRAEALFAAFLEVAEGRPSQFREITSRLKVRASMRASSDEPE